MADRLIEIRGIEYDLFELDKLSNEELERGMIDTSEVMKNDWLNPNMQINYKNLICALEIEVVKNRNGFVFMEMVNDTVHHITFMGEEE